MSLIEVHDLMKVFQMDEREAPTVALHNINCVIEPGEFVSIIGPSGSGKSTLLQIIGLLDSATSGTYRFKGKSVTEYSEDEQAALRNNSIGFIFQSFNLLPRTSVIENVKLPLAYSTIPKKEWDERAKKVIEIVGLSHRLTHEPAELSGGERQRVAIARALINNPEVIFADEPTGNLDSKSGGIILGILEKLNHDGHTVILITHDKVLARRARRIIYLHDGQIEWDGPAEQFTEMQ